MVYYYSVIRLKYQRAKFNILLILSALINKYNKERSQSYIVYTRGLLKLSNFVRFGRSCQNHGVFRKTTMYLVVLKRRVQPSEIARPRVCREGFIFLPCNN